MRLKINATVVAVLGMYGCAKAPETAQHTVAEYRSNKALRKQVFEKCVNDPGTLGKTPDCINAREAERLESHGSLRGSGKIGLDPGKH